MTISFSVSTSSRVSADAIGVPVGSDGPVSPKVGIGRRELTDRGFDGKVGQTLVMHGLGGSAVVVAVGVGELNKFTPTDARKSAAAFARAAGKAGTLSTTLANIGRGNKAAIAQAVVEGIRLATHRYVDLKNDKSNGSRVSEVTLVATAQNEKAIARGVKEGTVIADAVCSARDWANTPPSHLTARMIADKAVEIAHATGLEVSVYNKDQLIQMGCGGVIGVNQGSVEAATGCQVVICAERCRQDPACGSRGQRCDVRLGWHQFEAFRPIACRHENGHEWCSSRARHYEHACGFEVQGTC